MFKTRYQRKMKMLSWLRKRLWFNEDIPEYLAYMMIPKKVLDEILDVYEDWDICYTHYWPYQVNQFWYMFQIVKKYIELRWDTEKQIEFNLEEATRINKELMENLEKEKEEMLKRFIKIRGENNES